MKILFKNFSTTICQFHHTNKFTVYLLFFCCYFANFNNFIIRIKNNIFCFWERMRLIFYNVMKRSDPLTSQGDLSNYRPCLYCWCYFQRKLIFHSLWLRQNRPCSQKIRYKTSYAFNQDMKNLISILISGTNGNFGCYTDNPEVAGPEKVATNVARGSPWFR